MTMSYERTSFYYSCVDLQPKGELREGQALQNIRNNHVTINAYGHLTRQELGKRIADLREIFPKGTAPFKIFRKDKDHFGDRDVYLYEFPEDIVKKVEGHIELFPTVGGKTYKKWKPHTIARDPPEELLVERLLVIKAYNGVVEEIIRLEN